MTVYPNPTTGVVNVQCAMNNVQVGMVEFQLFDAYGRLLRIADGVETQILRLYYFLPKSAGISPHSGVFHL